jgi:hypothetical protein
VTGPHHFNEWNHMRMNASLHARLLLGAVLVTACGGSAPRAVDQTVIAPTMTIERFLRAANQNDLDTMASLFGTRDGAIAVTWPRQEIDSRMFLLASVLRHSDYTIGAEQIVPGRREEATRYQVRLTVSGERVDVPFTLVRTARSREWLIEDIDIERVTRGPGRR